MNTTSEIACINSALSLIDDSISNLLDKCDVIRLKVEKIEKEAIPTKRLPKAGELVWVRNGTDSWLPRVCIEAYINKQKIHCQFAIPKNNNDGYTWNEWKFYNEIIFTAEPLEHLPKDNAKQIKDTLEKVKFIDEYTRTAVNEGTVMAKENKDV